VATAQSLADAFARQRLQRPSFSPTLARIVNPRAGYFTSRALVHRPPLGQLLDPSVPKTPKHLLKSVAKANLSDYTFDSAPIEEGIAEYKDFIEFKDFLVLDVNHLPYVR